jgi:hypothetical protein
MLHVKYKNIEILYAQHTGCWKPVWLVKKVAPPSVAAASCEYGLAETGPTAPADNAPEAVTNGSKALEGVMVPFPLPWMDDCEEKGVRSEQRLKLWGSRFRSSGSKSSASALRLRVERLW